MLRITDLKCARVILLSLLAPLFFTGCATYALEPKISSDFAQVSIVLEDGTPVESNYYGLLAVGNSLFASGARSVVWVRSGERSVGFACPGTIFVDWPPTLDYVFEPGARYELVCLDGKGSIRKARDSA